MPMDLAQFRKLVAIDESDALSRFALGQALFQQGHSPEMFSEAAEHLTFANAKDPEHLATYHILGQVLIKLGRDDAARTILRAGVTKTAGVGVGMGHDLGPAMAKLLETL
jgi:Flp pilus assembly protein TadD